MGDERRFYTWSSNASDKFIHLLSLISVWERQRESHYGQPLSTLSELRCEPLKSDSYCRVDRCFSLYAPYPPLPPLNSGIWSSTTVYRETICILVCLVIATQRRLEVNTCWSKYWQWHPVWRFVQDTDSIISGCKKFSLFVYYRKGHKVCSLHVIKHDGMYGLVRHRCVHPTIAALVRQMLQDPRTYKDLFPGIDFLHAVCRVR